jgi:hypothetical protein
VHDRVATSLVAACAAAGIPIPELLRQHALRDGQQRLLLLSRLHEVTTIAASDSFLEKIIPTFPDERLANAVAFVKDNDPQGAAFTFVTETGDALPNTKQRLYGKIYLKALNKMRRAVEAARAARAATTAF